MNQKIFRISPLRQDVNRTPSDFVHMPGVADWVVGGSPEGAVSSLRPLCTCRHRSPSSAPKISALAPTIPIPHCGFGIVRAQNGVYRLHLLSEFLKWYSHLACSVSGFLPMEEFLPAPFPMRSRPDPSIISRRREAMTFILSASISILAS